MLDDEQKKEEDIDDDDDGRKKYASDCVKQWKRESADFSPMRLMRRLEFDAVHKRTLANDIMEIRCGKYAENRALSVELSNRLTHWLWYFDAIVYRCHPPITYGSCTLYTIAFVGGIWIAIKMKTTPVTVLRWNVFVCVEKWLRNERKVMMCPFDDDVRNWLS